MEDNVEEIPINDDESNSNILDTSGNPILEFAGSEAEDSTIGPRKREVKRVGRFSTFMNLCNALIGAGIVGVPSTFKECGVGPTVILLLITCALCYVCGNVLINMQREYEVAGIDEIGYHVFGKAGEIIVSILCMVFSLSCTVAYLIIGATKVKDWIELSPLKIGDNVGKWALLAFIYGMVLPIALTIPRRVGFLSYFSTVTVISICFYAVALIVKSSLKLNTGSIDPSVIGYRFGTGVFTTFSVHALTFSVPIVMMPVLVPYNPSRIKRRFVTGLVFVVSFFIVTVPSMMVYLTEGDSLKSDVLSSFENDDGLIIAVQIAIFFVVSFSYPVVCQTLTGSLGQLFYNNGVPELLTLKQRLILIPAINAVNLIIAMFLQDIKPVLGIGGSIGGCLVVFTFPSVCRLKMTNRPLYDWRNILHIIMAIFGIITCCLCTYYSILDAIAAYS